MKKLLLLAAVLLIDSSWLGAQSNSGMFAPQEDEQCRQWVDQTLAGMSLKQKVGQLFVCTIAPKNDRKTQKQVKQLAKNYQVGALLYSQGTVLDQVRLTNLAQQSSGIPLLITFDGEWGLATRLNQTPLFPKNAALGCIEDNNLIEEYGREVARQLHLLGVQVNFAPDADVNTNPANPSINVRSFGENPKAVADKVIAYSRGLESSGILSVAKHFPGHGDTYVDSHEALPRVYYDRNRLDSVELYPFKEAIRSGVSGVMVGHLLVPALEPDGITPSSLSHTVVTRLLKDELGFQGLVFCDALAMKSVDREPDVTVRALRAGSDLVLIQSDISKAQQSVLQAIASGTLSLKEIEAKCRKILTYKYRLGLNRRPKITTDGLTDRIDTAESQALAARLRKAAITVLGNHFNTIPFIANQGPIAILSVGEAEADRAFLARFSQYIPAEHFQLTSQTTADEHRQLKEKLRTFSRVIISVTADESQIANYQPLMQTLDLPMPTVYTFFTPYRTLLRLETVLTPSSAVVLAHSAEEELQHYVADVLLAKAPTQGKLSVSIGSLFRAGEGAVVVPGMSAGGCQPEEVGMKGYLLQRIDSVMRAGLEAGAYPGCQVVVLKDGKTIYDRCFGTRSDKDRAPVTPTDLYDLGSLSQSTATRLAVMKLCDEGKLRLTDPAATYLPWLRNTDKKRITIQELLLHQSGLLPYIRFYRLAIDEHTVEGPLTQGFVDQWHRTRMGEHTYACSDFKYLAKFFSPRATATHTLNVAQGMWLTKSFKNTILQSIAHSELSEKQWMPSDLGFIVLQQVVEAITKRPMNEYLDATFYTPMGLTRTLFQPLNRYPATEIIPTASNEYLRRQDLQGYVYDEAAAFMGGVSGNAGLFSTAREVGQLYQMLLNGGEWNGQRYLSREICQQFAPLTTATRSNVDGQDGAAGTCAWADPAHGLVYVFLSNRLCPNSWNRTLGDKKILQGIQTVIYRSLPPREGAVNNAIQ